MECEGKLVQQGEEYEFVLVQVGENDAPFYARFYYQLRFALLASSWLPEPLGVFLWSVLHVLLLLCGMLLTPPAVITGVSITVCLDVLYLLVFVIWHSVMVPFGWLFLKMWLILSCQLRESPKERSDYLKRWHAGWWDVFIRVSSGNVPSEGGGLLLPFTKELIAEIISTEWISSFMKRWCEEVVHMYDCITIY